MKKIIILLSIVLASFLVLTACGEDHSHNYGDWEMVVKADCQTKGVMVRTCSCGHSETSMTAIGGHKTEKIPAVAATCTVDGLTEGEKCSVCGVVTIPQQTVGKSNHSLEKTPAVPATCQTEGLTEGEKCSVCGYVTKEQQKVEKLAHNYNSKVTTEATCTTKGVKTFTCADCKYSYTEQFEMEKYTGVQVHEMTKNSVGQIKTYGKGGLAYSTGTGFVWSEDGKIITNYHVIEHAFSAEIVLAGKTYKIEKVLGYDSNLDIAILQINATGLTPIKVCAEPTPTASTVFAFGNPKGYTATFSQGVVTNNNRVIDGITYIQHDAALSSGNSGGPLINEYCEVIGINTWVRLDGQNLNFAVSSKEIANIDTTQSFTIEDVYYTDHAIAYFELIDWIDINGENDGKYVDIYQDFENGWYNIYYVIEDKNLCISRFMKFDDGDVYAVYISLDHESEQYEAWSNYTFANGDEINTTAVITAYATTPDTNIVIETIDDARYKNDLASMHNNAMHLTLQWFKGILEQYTYLTMDDFGFMLY